MTAMLSIKTFIGSVRGVAFTLTDNGGVVALRDDPTPAQNHVPIYPLGENRPGSYYIQLKDKT